MKYGVTPTNLFERIALATGKVPIPLIDSLFGIIKARALMAGVRLGVFQALAGGPQTAAQLAAGLQLDERVLELLLRSLVFGGYLSQRKSGYELSPLARRTMIEGGDMELWGYVLWNYQQWEMVAGLEDAVRSGRGCEFHNTLKDPEAWRHYQRGMLELARLEASVIAAKVRVRPGARSLLDVGGSHGLIGAAICRKHPPMRSTVLELPQALPHARELASSEGIDDVVEHRAASLLEDDWGAEHDVVLLVEHPASLRARAKPLHLQEGCGGAPFGWRSGGVGSGTAPARQQGNGGRRSGALFCTDVRRRRLSRRRMRAMDEGGRFRGGASGAAENHAGQGAVDSKTCLAPRWVSSHRYQVNCAGSCNLGPACDSLGA